MMLPMVLSAILFMRPSLANYANAPLLVDPKDGDVVALASAEASVLLESVGISGLCHPTSEEFEPYFPLCSPLLLPLPPHRLLSGADSIPSFQDDEWFYFSNSLCALGCVCMAALAAGLTMGLLSLDPLLLLIKMRAGSTQEEKNQAASLLPVVKQRHLLLVTLLLLNSIANEALPLFLDNIFPSYIAILISVVGVLFFGEIIPSAVFTGPDQMKIAAHMVPIVRVVMCLLYPLAYPIAKLLDHLLHDDEESSLYNRGELSALVRIQYEERLAGKQRRKAETRNVSLPDGAPPSLILANPSVDYSLTTSIRAHKKAITKSAGDMVSSAPPATNARRVLNKAPSIHFDEVSMVEGALAMGTKVASDVYTPLRKLFAIPSDAILDERCIVEIYSSGYSRVPVYDPNPRNDIQSIRGLLLTKQLMVVSAEDCRPVSTLPLQKPYCIAPTKNLIDCINLFQTGGTSGKGGHMALVCARPAIAMDAFDKDEAIPDTAGVMGVLTLEDVLEELLQEKIYDEMDHLEQSKLKAAKWAIQKWKLFNKKRKLKREEDELEGMHSQYSPSFLGVVSDALSAAEHGTLLSEETPLLVTGTAAGADLTKNQRPSFFGLFGPQK
jgi:metal transporter CNNM